MSCAISAVVNVECGKCYEVGREMQVLWDILWDVSSTVDPSPMGYS